MGTVSRVSCYNTPTEYPYLRRTRVQDVAMNLDTAIEILYTNYRGETSRRKIVPSALRFGATEYHPQPQWLLDAYDVGKQAERTFAMLDIQEWKPA